MSIKLMSLAWDSSIPSTEKMVLLCLCDFANDEGQNCYPSVAKISRKTSKNERTVQRALRWLEDNGILTSHERSGTSTNYTIHPRQFDRGDNLTGVTKTTKGGGTVSPRGRRGVTLTINEPPIEPLNNNTRAKPFSKPDGIDETVWNDFVALRKAKKAPISGTALKAIEREAGKVGWQMNEALAECVARGWQGFKADWIKQDGSNRGNSNGGMGRTEQAAERLKREISSGAVGFGQSAGGYATVQPRPGNRIIDAQSDPVRSIGYVER
jgi:DNA-binding transcriptional ArsR family regulator